MSINEDDKLGKDLKLRFDELGADLAVTRKGDLSTIEEEDNLAQAIICRLTTEEGELYDLGHADYGSRLHEVIGEINNDLTRHKIKSIVQDCLSEEPRIAEIVSVNVLSDLMNHHKVNIELTVLPQKTKKPITLYYPFRLEG
jgi:phage baseplate assembly protein W